LLWIALFTAPFLVSHSWAYNAPPDALNAVSSDFVIQSIEVSSSSVPSLLRYYGKKNGLSDTEVSQVLEVVRCESQFNPSAVNIHDSEKGSWGLAQINLSAHPNITKEQALNKYYASWFITSEFANNNEWKWTCFRNIYGVE
jgi:soluble lytic murein transglycosylase-like protein